MKKLIIELLTILSLFACSIINKPTDKVKQYLNEYQNLSENVLLNLETIIDREDLSNSNKELYKEVLKRNYKSLKYNIKEETINDNESTVTVEITVKDLYKSKKESELFFIDNQKEFEDENGTYDNNKYMEYELNKMLETNNEITYNIEFKLTKDNNSWILENPTEETISKINGLYDYETIK